MELLKKYCKFHHAGIVVKNLSKYVTKNNIILDRNNGVKVAFLKIGDLKIELVEALKDNPHLDKYLKGNKQIYHLAFMSNNLKKALEEAKKNNFIQINPKKPAKAFDDKSIIWLYHDLYGLVEIIKE
jgi:4-hydroxyphenylpyruvate dioxygenase-like putative hemolysin